MGTGGGGDSWGERGISPLCVLALVQSTGLHGPLWPHLHSIGAWMGSENMRPSHS